MRSKHWRVVTDHLELNLPRAHLRKASGYICERCAQHVQESIPMALVFSGDG